MKRNRIMDLASGLQRIAQAYQEEKRTFFYYVGAGVSAPVVPLAKDLIALAAKHKPEISLGESNEKELGYAQALKQIFPEQKELQSFLAMYNQGMISAANTLLARLLIEQAPARLALTGNFDTGLEESLRLQGEDVQVFQSAPPRLVDDGVQLVYLQGSVGLHSLEGIVSGYPVMPQEKNQSLGAMESCVQTLLQDHSCMVLGFSGREDNAFMRGLHSILSGSEACGDIYWFLHTEDELYALPDWLTGHSSVFFIGQHGIMDSERIPFVHEEDTNALQIRVTNLMQGIQEGVLPATTVLQGLIDVFSVPLPSLWGNPHVYLQKKQQLALGKYGHVDKELLEQKFRAYSIKEETSTLYDVQEMVLSYHTEQAGETLMPMMWDDLDEIGRRHWIRLALLVALYLSSSNSAKDNVRWRVTHTNLLEKVVDWAQKIADETAFSQGLEARLLLAHNQYQWKEYVSAQNQFSKIILAIQGQDRGDDSYSAIYDQCLTYRALCFSFQGKIPEALSGLDQPGYRLPQNEEKKPYVKAFCLLLAGRYQETVHVLEELISDAFTAGLIQLICYFNLEDAEKFHARIQDIMSVVEKRIDADYWLAVLMYMQAKVASKDEDAYPIKSWNRLIQRFQDAYDHDVRRIRAQGLLEKAHILKEGGSYVEAIKVYGQLAADYQYDLELDMLLLCIRAGFEKANVKRELTWYEEAKQDLIALVDTHQALDADVGREWVIQAKFALGELEIQSGQPVAAKKCFEDILHQYDYTVSVVVRRFMAKSQLELGVLFNQDKDHKTALTIFDRLVETFQSYQEFEVELVLAQAYLLSAKTYLENRYIQESIDKAQDGIVRLTGVKQMTLKVKSGELWRVLLDALEQHGKLDLAIDKAQEFLDIRPEETEVPLVLQRAKVLMVLAALQHKKGQNTEALKNYDRFVVRYGNLNNQEIEQDLLDVFQKRAEIQRQLGQHVNALRSLDSLLNKLRPIGDSRYDELMARSYLEKATIHLEDEQFAQQLAVLSEMDDYFSERSGDKIILYRMLALYERAKNYLFDAHLNQAMQDLEKLRQLPLTQDTEASWEVLSRSLRMEVSILKKQNQPERMKDLVEENIERISLGRRDETRKNILAILRDLQEVLVQYEKHEQIVINATRILRLFAQESSLDYQRAVAQALFEKIRANYAMREKDIMAIDLETLREHVANQTDQFLQEMLVQSLILWGDILVETGEPTASIDVYANISNTYSVKKEMLFDHYLALVQYKQARTYMGIGSSKTAFKIYQDLVKRFGSSKDLQVLQQVYRGSLDIAAIFIDRRRDFWGQRYLRKAHKIYDNLIIKTDDFGDLELQKIRAKSLFSKAKLFVLQEKHGEASRQFNLLNMQYQLTEDPYIRSLVEKAKEESGYLESTIG